MEVLMGYPNREYRYPEAMPDEYTQSRDRQSRIVQSVFPTPSESGDRRGCNSSGLPHIFVLWLG